MKRICITVIVFVFCLVMPTFAQVRKKYYVKLMPHDYSNWVWDELKDVKSCEKTADGLQYVIVYKGVAAPRAIRPAIGNSKGILRTELIIQNKKDVLNGALRSLATENRMSYTRSI